MRKTIDNISHPEVRAFDLHGAQRSGGFLHVKIDGISARWRVLAMSLGDDEWSATVELVERDGPRGPLTEPRRRRG